MRVEQAALEDVGAVAQGTGTLARLLAALGSTLGTLLAFFGDVIPNLALKLSAQMGKLRTESTVSVR